MEAPASRSHVPAAVRVPEDPWLTDSRPTLFKTFRNRARIRVSTVAVVLWTVAWPYELAAGDPRFRGLGLYLFMVPWIFVGYGLFYALGFRPAMIVEADGTVVVRGPLRTRSTTLAQVKEFVVSSPSLEVHLLDGTVIPVWALQPANITRMTSRMSGAELVARYLNKALAELRRS